MLRILSASSTPQLPQLSQLNGHASSLEKRIWVLLGFPMTYGIFQEYYTTHWTFKGNPSAAGVIGTTSNGVIYLSMPLLFAALSRRWAHHRRASAYAGLVLTSISYLLSSWSTAAWQLVLTQGVLAALGSALLYSPTTLTLSESYATHNRAVALAVVLSAKNITGSVCPFLINYLLSHHGFRTTMRIWAGLSGALALAAVFLMPMGSTTQTRPFRARKIPWTFLTHRTFWIYVVAIALQSSGYGLPQTYLNTYAHDVAHASAATSTLLITLFNAPGILSSSLFGLLSDNKHVRLSASTVVAISAFASGLSAFLLWGIAGSGSHSMALLILFSIIYGCFAGAYSATWGGVLKEMEKEAGERNEAIDSGMVYGLFNGARGVGFVSGGLVGVQLVKVGGEHVLGKFGYGTIYGPLIVYVGLSTCMGGWSVFLKMGRLFRW
ncbi:MFS general substrate transporter [Microthyrium microscopicum]|uniref:MFS general substrate transporter n=1 Tax=Microthyrium microscopicum TaxID=703497 RepID=A0A6A6TXE1_9PEZI|nr:MFS general substrate transporter [Microthyrium microscopicum]